MMNRFCSPLFAAALAFSACGLLADSAKPIPAPASKTTPPQQETVKAPVFLLTAKSDKPDGFYHPGEIAAFTAELKRSDGLPVLRMHLRYRIARNGFWEEPVSVTSDKTLLVSVKMDQPGWVAVEFAAFNPDGTEIKQANGRALVVQTGAMFDPEKLKESAPEPPDFDAFWKEQREILNRVPVEAERIPVKTVKKFVCYDVTVKCAGAKPVSGYLTMPEGAKPGTLPAIVSFHGAGVRSAGKPTLAGAIRFDVNAHGIPNGRTREFYETLYKTELKSYYYIGKTDRNTFYFNDMYLRIMRALDYIKTVPEWDGKTLIVQGGSQGGGQAIVAAALDPQVTFCYASVPALGDHCGRLAGRLPGWPHLADRLDNPDVEQVLAASKYFDNVYFAKRIHCEVSLATGFIDFVCPPTSVYAVYNNLPGEVKKHMQTTVNAGHGAPSDQARARMFEIVSAAAPKPEKNK